MTTPSAINDDHLRLLALARAAFAARDDGKLWKRSPDEAIETHGACCDALWAELERQVILADGGVPVLDHPTVRRRKMARQMRGAIVATVQQAVVAALDDIEDGLFELEP